LERQAGGRGVGRRGGGAPPGLGGALPGDTLKPGGRASGERDFSWGAKKGGPGRGPVNFRVPDG